MPCDALERFWRSALCNNMMDIQKGGRYIVCCQAKVLLIFAFVEVGEPQMLRTDFLSSRQSDRLSWSLWRSFSTGCLMQLRLMDQLQILHPEAFRVSQSLSLSVRSA